MQVYACSFVKLNVPPVGHDYFLSTMWYVPSSDSFLFLQGEMQQLRDKLAVAERTARSEAQLKVHNFLRLVMFCLLLAYWLSSLTYGWNLLQPLYIM